MTTIARHTEGPWTVGKPTVWHGHGFLPIGPERTATGPTASVTVSYPLVASIHPENDKKGCVNWSERDYANARLIAAAPDGLNAATMAYLALLQLPHGTMRLACQATLCALRDFIAKATGHDAEHVQNLFEARAASATEGRDG